MSGITDGSGLSIGDQLTLLEGMSIGHQLTYIGFDQPSSNALLLQDGSYLLLQDGGHILLEA